MKVSLGISQWASSLTVQPEDPTAKSQKRTQSLREGHASCSICAVAFRNAKAGQATERQFSYRKKFEKPRTPAQEKESHLSYT